MTKANPADGVWFIVAHLGKGPFLPMNVPQDYYLVWSGLLCCKEMGEEEPAALLFQRVVRTLPDTLEARNLADDRARECLKWLNRSAGSRKPMTEWPDPPHPFVLALSSTPGASISFCIEGEKEPDRQVLQHLMLVLRSVWSAWKAWGEAEGIPEHPALKTATFYEDDRDS